MTLNRVFSLHFFLGLGAATCLPAFAASDDVFRPYVGYSLVREDNVLGVPDGAAPSGEKHADTSRHAEAGLIFNKRVNQQVLSAKLDFSHITYERLGGLDNDSKDLLANWNWHVGNHIEGNLGTSYV